MSLVLGIDPGLATIGVALVDSVGARKTLLNVGVVTTPAGMPGPKRLASIHRDLLQLLGQMHPEAAAVEQLFFSSNSTTAMQVAEARGVILLAMEECGVPVWEYTPMQVKVSLTGYGKASKAQMTRMVRALVSVPEKLPDDAFDAVAIALCHLQSERLSPGRRIS
ncbi:MAG TPA: crossover junction endodeoxyribonuclease RuvC [Candidatus Dormibacteraeota bacterium]|nr:crossover junction endodeoxyribonuclease RuvC [Candidatus Dormibacteraeota bacterium]